MYIKGNEIHNASPVTYYVKISLSSKILFNFKLLLLHQFHYSHSFPMIETFLYPQKLSVFLYEPRKSGKL